MSGNELSLGEKQELFTLLMAEFLVWIYEQGYRVRGGHWLRCTDCRIGRDASCHKIKLAFDINLFKNGQYLQTTEDHKPLGEKWESMHPLCSWGGHFNDGNHYSFAHDGKR